VEAKSFAVNHLTLSRSMLLGLLGGLIGSLVFSGLGYLTPTRSGYPFYVSPFVGMGLSVTAAYTVGWVLNVVVGLVFGALFALTAHRIRQINAQRIGRGTAWGLVVGFVEWLVYSLPMIGASEGLAHPLLMGATLIFALIYGAIVGAIYSSIAMRYVSAKQARTVSA